MKDFERKLEQQPMREIPAGWRREILTAAERSQRSASTPTVSEEQAALAVGWRLLLGRLPLAWSALAAVWLVLIGANLILQGPVVGVPAQARSAGGLADPATLELLLSDFDGAGDYSAPNPEAAPRPRQPAGPPRPRSELRRELDLGDVHPDFLADHAV
jgi:hypothetical protein